MMHSQYIQKNSFTVADLLQRPFRRQYRSQLIAGITFTLLVGVWLFNGFGVGSFMTWSATDQQPKVESASLIPHKIWQIMFPRKSSPHKLDPKVLAATPSWLALNPHYDYTLIDQARADRLFEEHFSDMPEVVRLWNSLTHMGMKSDLLRYAILYVEGGVYTDTDTVAIKPIDDWVPDDFVDEARLVVGIEFDRRDGNAWADISHWLQFCQWTLAAAPRHPVFLKMIQRIVQSVGELASKYEVSPADLKPTSFEVMNSTAPAAWTDVVFAHLQEYEPSLNDTKDLSYMMQPRLIDDVLILTIDAFGMGQQHSHSTNDGSIPEVALAQHLFGGSWRGD